MKGAASVEHFCWVRKASATATTPTTRQLKQQQDKYKNNLIFILYFFLCVGCRRRIWKAFGRHCTHLMLFQGYTDYVHVLSKQSNEQLKSGMYEGEVWVWPRLLFGFGLATSYGWTRVSFAFNL